MDSSNVENQRKFHKISFFHQLFTSNDDTNGQLGGALQIPYYWHWVNPNPRHQIFSVTQKKFLSDITPPAGFEQYKCFAELDRTPEIFYKDLFSETPLYQSTIGESFYTFGWCSEREMAFVSLMEEMGFQGKVVINWNHSWSVFKESFRTNSNEIINVSIKVDNTFNRIGYWELWKEDLKDFTNSPTDKLSKWYNEKAHSEVEKANVRAITVSSNAQQRIDSMIVGYFSKFTLPVKSE